MPSFDLFLPKKHPWFPGGVSLQNDCMRLARDRDVRIRLLGFWSCYGDATA